jgi:hypothetical protein
MWRKKKMKKYIIIIFVFTIISNNADEAKDHPNKYISLIIKHKDTISFANIIISLIDSNNNCKELFQVFSFGNDTTSYCKLYKKHLNYIYKDSINFILSANIKFEIDEEWVFYKRIDSCKYLFIKDTLFMNINYSKENMIEQKFDNGDY